MLRAMSAKGTAVQAGDRFRTVADIATDVLISWSAPLTSGAKCVIPAGTVLVASYHQVEGARGFGCAPEAYDELLPIVIPAEDRGSEKFGGYYFVFVNDDIGTKLEKLAQA